MSILRTLIITAVTSFVVTPLNVWAQQKSVWVRVSAACAPNPKKGTIYHILNRNEDGSFREDGTYGLGWNVDAKSIVKRGNYVYFNLDVTKLDRACRNKEGHIWKDNAWQADCSRGLTKGPNAGWTDGNPKLVEFVCR
ncbi:hypothetical protein [Prochlorococcus sp. MIT 1307]|uniref:hypothetical protein n=1 Tax=Prochlorococcus sp. MIT 1307 TaxID=3096219 RepID=UPI002A76175F|nr:hypothetical protein [Prochlorococcus sp. MIT 1307]